MTNWETLLLVANAQREAVKAMMAEAGVEGLSTRARGCLLNENIMTLAQARRLTMAEMLIWPNCGKTTAAEIWQAFHPGATPPAVTYSGKPIFPTVDAAVEYLRANDGNGRLEVIVDAELARLRGCAGAAPEAAQKAAFDVGMREDRDIHRELAKR